MINAYALVQSGLLLTGRQRRRPLRPPQMLLFGLALFGAGSLAAGLAQSTGS